MSFFSTLNAAKFAAKLSAAAAGFDFDAALKAGDENALKAHIEKAVAAVPKADAAQIAQIDTLEAGLASATSENAAVSQNLAVLTASLTAVGFKFPSGSSSQSESDQVAAHKKALEDHIKIRAQAILAQGGHPALADVPMDGNGGATLTGAERTRAAFEKQRKQK